MTTPTSPASLLSYLYFLQGLPYGLQARFLPIYFRTHGMSLSNIGFIKVLFFPWMCKTVWAPFVDHHGNKKTWLLWSMVGLGLTCVLAAGIEPSWMTPLCIILLVFNFLTSTQDIATDGLAIEILTSSQVASGNIAQVVGFKFGAIIGGGLLAWLSDLISWAAIFSFLTLIYATAVAMVMIFVPESSGNSMNITVDVLKPLTAEPCKNSSESHTIKKNDVKEVIDSPSCDILNKSKHITRLTLVTGTADHTGSCISEESDHQAKHDCHQRQCENENTAVQSNEVPGQQHWNSESSGSKLRGGLWWIVDHFATVLQAEGTVWILFYVLIYKLGEQGALSMMPLFLIDRGVPVASVGLWTGVIGQAVSITGSVLGGAAISSRRYTALNFLRLLSILKVMVLASQTLAVSTWFESGTLGVGEAPCVFLMLMLLGLSGAVSTSAFTLMMQCSQRARPQCRASHYSLLATAEVLGKLTFSIFVGAVTDLLGYSLAFGLFLALSLTVMPLFTYAPGILKCTGGSLNKHC